MKHKIILSTIIFFSFTININNAASITYVKSDTIVTENLSKNAIIRQEAGFEQDFLVLHCLVKKHQPKNLFEVGTCEGYGTLIMANACPSCSIISLDLPPNSPPFFLPASRIGFKCKKPYTQVFGESLTYNYEQHFPVDAWFIDGAHDYDHVKYETEQAVKGKAHLIVYHDTDIPQVFQAVIDGLEGTSYDIYRVIDTRISYAIHPETK